MTTEKRINGKYDRRSIRLKFHDYSKPGKYFLTICTENRDCLFGKVIGDEMIINQNGTAVQKTWNGLPARYENIRLDAFIIMPNHIHGIVEITGCVNFVGAIHELPLRELRIRELPIRIQRRQMLLPNIIGYFKMNSAKLINGFRGFSGIPVWQRNYYEHVIRDDRSLDRIRNYIRNNPANWRNDWNFMI